MMQQGYTLVHPDGRSFEVKLSFPGMHAVYNSLAALTVLDSVGLLDQGAIDWLWTFKPPYGRFEKIELDGRTILLMLVKNPAGANASLDILAQHVPSGDVLLLLNDLAADGRDISWIYDAAFEKIARSRSVTTGGLRARAMALRMLHAGVDASLIEAEDGSIEEAFDLALARTEEGHDLAVIATYTAMHAVRAVLVRRAGIREFWKDGR
jgi:UDP-N-acetylmuramyl tripeptide synthase